jgi:hypothetical protein
MYLCEDFFLPDNVVLYCETSFVWAVMLGPARRHCPGEIDATLPLFSRGEKNKIESDDAQWDDEKKMVNLRSLRNP